MPDLYPKYSEEQADRLLSHIGFTRLTAGDISDLNNSSHINEKHDEKLAVLTDIKTQALITLPFENLSLHYNPFKAVAIDHDAVLDKVLVSGSAAGGTRGGYCMENNALMATLLRSLGFHVRSVSGRVWHGDYWTGFSHMVNLVRIGDTLYQVDIGFGPNGPARPIPLPSKSAVRTADGAEHHTHIAPARARLLWRNIKAYYSNVEANGAHSEEFKDDDGTRMWIYELSTSSDAEWQPVYAYSELECFPIDFDSMNLWPSTSPRIFFTQKVVCVRFVLGTELPSLTDGKTEAAGDGIVGQLILFHDNVKLRVQGEDVGLPFPPPAKEGSGSTCRSEAERVEVLRRFFNIKLSSAQQRAIAGMPSEIA